MIMSAILQDRIQAFSQLGSFLQAFVDNNCNAIDVQALLPLVENAEAFDSYQQQLADYVQSAEYTHNAWFTPSQLTAALRAWGQVLTVENLDKFTKPYALNKHKEVKTVGLVMAGNLPIVGFHDYLCVVLSGHKALVKLSSDDTVLLPLLHELLSTITPALKESAQFAKDSLKGMDAVIATGSNNSARYFDYYFGKYPHIIRRNRHSVAVLQGDETESDLQALSHDILQYFGRGCRSVSKLYLPKDYPVHKILDVMQAYKWLLTHSKYMNNYEYNKAIFLVNAVPHLDNGYVLLTENTAFSSPIAVVHYTFYNSLQEVETELQQHQDQLQCIVGNNAKYVPFGKSQQPELDDFADGVDTLQFLAIL